MKVLVADDDPVSRRVIEFHLTGWGHQAVTVADGMAALEALAADSSIQLLISDWTMPRLDGLELCRRARNGLRRAKYLHIIMLTARGEKTDLIRAMAAGVDVFLTKPFDAPELRSLLGVVDRMSRLESQLAERLGQLTRALDRIRADLRAAARVQQSLLPQVAPEVEGLEFGWVYESCDEVAGDMFNVFRLDDEHVGLYVLDVSGHGVPSALLSVALSRTLTPHADQGGVLLRRGAGTETLSITPPAEVAAELNRRFPVMGQSNQYFTMLYGILHVPTRRFSYVRAGHPGPIIVSRGTVEMHMEGGSLPVGMMEEVTYTETSVDLPEGAMVVLLTDGVEEAMNAKDEQFGLEEVFRILDHERAGGVAGTLERLRAAVLQFRGNRPQSDDITLVGFGLANGGDAR